MYFLFISEKILHGCLASFCEPIASRARASRPFSVGGRRPRRTVSCEPSTRRCNRNSLGVFRRKLSLHQIGRIAGKDDDASSSGLHGCRRWRGLTAREMQRRRLSRARPTRATSNDSCPDVSARVSLHLYCAMPPYALHFCRASRCLRSTFSTGSRVPDRSQLVCRSDRVFLSSKTAAPSVFVGPTSGFSDPSRWHRTW